MSDQAVLNVISVVGTIASLAGVVLSLLAFKEAKKAASGVAHVRDTLSKRHAVERLVSLLKANAKNMRDAIGRPDRLRGIADEPAAAAARVELLLDLLPVASTAPHRSSPSLAARLKLFPKDEGVAALDDLSHLVETADELKRLEVDKHVGL